MTNRSDELRKGVYKFLEVKWNPSTDLVFVAASYLALVTCLYMAFRVVTTTNVALNFILYGPVSMLMLGVVLPVAYNSLAKKRPLSSTGITSSNVALSLGLGIVLGVNTYMNTLNKITLPPFVELLPLAVMAVTVGLFESVFFRGWVQLRLEDAFGAIPSIILGAGMYSLYHIGYGMTLQEMRYLFVLGVVFATAFRVTRNIAVLWPFYTWIGGLYTNLSEGLRLPFESIYGFTIVFAAMVASIAYIYVKTRDRGTA
jgi:hypothetical protein